jgi:hypothetical protein
MFFELASGSDKFRTKYMELKKRLDIIGGAI